jgi:addiction module HigA family antidote
MPSDRLPPIHPGEILGDEPETLALSANALARDLDVRDLDVPVNRVTEIVNGKRAITADTALRLGRYFGTSPQFWLNLQTAYDLALATAKSGAAIAKRVRL